MREIFIFEDKSQDNVTVVTNSQSVVLKAKRADLAKVVNLVDKPGVYILMSDGLSYIGQSGKSVSSRLISHNREKDWWDSFIVITDLHGALDKSLVEYLEAYYISKLRNSGVLLDNDTDGNFVNPSRFTILNAMEVIDKADLSLSEFLGVDLTKKKKEQNTPTHSRVSVEIKNTDTVIEGSSYPKALTAFLLYCLNDNPQAYSLLWNEITPFPTIKAPLSSSPGDEMIELESDLYLMKSIPAKNAKELILYYSELLGVEIEMN